MPASLDRDWLLVFEDGLLRSWGENRANSAFGYEAEAIDPFLDWMVENHPEIGSLFPFVDGDWVVREGVAAEIAGFVAEWAADRDTTLAG